MRDDIYFLQAVAHVLAAAIERKAAGEERMRLGQEMAARVLQAQEEERSRIARELHDGNVQALSTMLVNLDLMDPCLPLDVDLRPRFEQVRSIAQRSLDETRALAHALRPVALDGAGLAAALKKLAREYASTFGMSIDVQAEPWEDLRLPPEAENAFLRVVQEAVANACKHSGAASVHVRLSRRDAAVDLLVEDDGVGFDPRRVPPPTARGGMGLSSMRERARLLGGTLALDAAPGKGTRLVLTVPLDSLTVGRQQHAPACSGTETSVLLVDDHAMFREGVRDVLGKQRGITIVGEAEDGYQAIRMVEALSPDIVLMDIAMPALNGLDATRQIKRRFPNVDVIVLTAHESREQLAQTVRVGAAACIVKRSAGTELLRAIQAVTQGQKYVSPAIAAMLLEDYQTRIDQDGEDILTEREREVLQLVAEGRTNQEIARRLVLSVKTVEGHRTNLMRKLGAHDRTDLVKYAIRMGMITPG
jgi:DNA-binding NarL/FixJ family response regulator/two-component sensor histidine kinase